MFQDNKLGLYTDPQVPALVLLLHPRWNQELIPTHRKWSLIGLADQY